MKGRPGHIKCKMKAVIGKERLKKNRKKKEEKVETFNRTKK